MIQHAVKIKKITSLNHDVVHIQTEKPKDYTYDPGQATHVRIDKDSYREERGAFTFSNLPEEDLLEFTIKTYPSHHGITEQIGSLKEGDVFLLEEVYGTIKHRGKGVFIAGGAGITPFIAILKSLEKEHKIDGHQLIFANKNTEDIILKEYFDKIMGTDFINILSEEQTEKFAYGNIDKKFLKETIQDFSQYFYLCGPPKMIESVEKDLKELGVDPSLIIKEGMDKD